MSRKIILHIGMHKTGSSSIQETLFSIGELYGFHYPKFNYLGKEYANHSILLYNIFGNAASYNVNRVNQVSQKELPLLINNLKEQLIDILNSDIDLVFSAEDISSMAETSLSNMIKFFHSYSATKSDIYTVGYVREPYAYHSSNIQEHVKSGKTLPEASKSVLETSYKSQIKKLKNSFENIDLFSFNKELLKFGDIFKSFNHYLFNLSTATVISDIKGLRSNEGIPAELVEYLSYLNLKEPLYDSSGIIHPQRSVNDYQYFITKSGSKFILDSSNNLYENKIKEDQLIYNKEFGITENIPVINLNEKWDKNYINEIEIKIKRSSKFYQDTWVEFLKTEANKIERQSIYKCYLIYMLCLKLRPEGPYIKARVKELKEKINL